MSIQNKKLIITEKYYFTWNGVTFMICTPNIQALSDRVKFSVMQLFGPVGIHCYEVIDSRNSHNHEEERP